VCGSVWGVALTAAAATAAVDRAYKQVTMSCHFNFSVEQCYA